MHFYPPPLPAPDEQQGQKHTAKLGPIPMSYPWASASSGRDMTEGWKHDRLVRTFHDTEGWSCCGSFDKSSECCSTAPLEPIDITHKALQDSQARELAPDFHRFLADKKPPGQQPGWKAEQIAQTLGEDRAAEGLSPLPFTTGTRNGGKYLRIRAVASILHMKPYNGTLWTEVGSGSGYWAAVPSDVPGEPGAATGRGLEGKDDRERGFESVDSMRQWLQGLGLESAHQKIGRMKTEEGVIELRENFHEYHDKYAEQREKGKATTWKSIPAEDLAVQIFNTFIGDEGDVDFKVIDFGCGDVGLFESELLQRIIGRSGSGTVKVAAVDVEKIDTVDLQCSDGSTTTKFICDAFAGDYGTCMDAPENASELTAKSFDVAIFCLSMMMQDALALGLMAAVKALKPMGKIIIVLDHHKFGLMYQGQDNTDARVKAWGDELKERTTIPLDGGNNTAFTLEKWWPMGTGTFICLQLDTPGLGASTEALSAMFEANEVTIKSLREEAEIRTPWIPGAEEFD